jgi:hypothetical protein
MSVDGVMEWCFAMPSLRISPVIEGGLPQQPKALFIGTCR